MRTAIRLKLEMARLVLDFHVVTRDLTPVARAAVARLGTLLAQVTALEDEQYRLQEIVRGSLEDRTLAEEELRSCLTQLLPLCRVVARQEGLAELNCQLRAGTRGTQFLAAEAAGLARCAAQHSDVLMRYGLPPGLLTELTDALDAHQTAEALRQTSLAARVALTPSIEAAVTAAHDIIHHLDALNHIRLAGDPARLAEWKAVRAVRWRRVLATDAA